ncbi:MAG: endolytic transglycosylase MltG [Geminicoccaceae bacterium]
MRRAFLFLFCLVLLTGGLGYGYVSFDAYRNGSGPNTEEKVVVLPRGAGLSTIVNQLDQASVIDHPWLFQLAVRLGGHDRKLKAGEYAFEPGITPNDIIAKLTEGKSLLRRFTVIEGQTVAEIFRLLDQAEGLVGDLPGKPKEGTLLPETYLYSQGDTRAHLVKRMQDAMTGVLEDAWAGREENLPYASPEEALIMASIVDKETAVAEERFEVAAVFVNRLRLGMRLQSDPTIIYGLTDGEGPLDRELTRQDWKLEDPFNTYVIDALPPGPIGNPGKSSIAAVMHPADVDYLYFVADGTGGHAFAVTLEEHNDNVARWRRIKAGKEQAPRPPSPPRPNPDLSETPSATPSPENAATTDQPKPGA